MIADIYPLPGFFEPFSAIVHLLGAIVFVWMMPFLLRRGRGDTNRMWFLFIYAFSCGFLLSISAVYHMMQMPGTARVVLRHLDQGAIFVLIAGTFTPVHGILFHGFWRWAPLVLFWTLTITAVTLTTVFRDDLDDWLSLVFYLSLGWIGVVSAAVLARRFGTRFIQPLLTGGVAYSVGAVMEMLGWFVVIPGVVHAHELFHVAVIVGAAFHWKFVWQLAKGPPAGLHKSEGFPMQHP